ncbi:hypothetical protein CJF30_00005499 [Rutstroemia sp. NJR-2017a BBW]|nr:hypothetical protein CJF30_00005885 [Rutstroemia sp. NJR-2017a BBW]PQE08632.1 hypothetical protein CJF30_00005499 [Rutstroemia sp. NJR-2017a BBW]
MSKFTKTGTWKPETTGRTNTGSTIRGKISAPIPIQDDDEFPIRSPGTGIATPLGSRTSDGLEKVMRGSAISGRESGLTQGENGMGMGMGMGMGSYVEPTRRIGSSPQASGRPSYNTYRRPETISAMRSPSPIGATSRSVTSKPQRKKSTLRGVFGKIFGKKRKDVPLGTRQGAEALQSEQHHRSDPTAMSRTQISTSTSPKRSTSMPINEFNRALRSHSPFAEALAQTHAERDPNRISTQTQSTATRTRVTTGRLYTPDKTPGYLDWTGLSPRPASSHARGSKVPSDEEEAGAIGMAVSSGSHPNRRSRSLGQLREAARAAGGIVRRRSDEIRYWRASYDPGPLSPLSSNKAEAEEPILMNDPEIPLSPPSRDQLQPFNFSQLSGLTSMKITQAADLETRVNQLESRMIEMEKTVYQMNRRLNGDHVTLQDPPRKGFRRNRSSSTHRPTTDNSEVTLPPLPRPRDWQNDQNRPSSFGSKRPSSSTHNSYHPEFDDTVPHQLTTSADDHIRHGAARPLSTSTTIRGNPSSSSPTMQKDMPITIEHYTSLTNMILAEQSARQHLETVILSLQQQICTLQTSNSTSNSYLTPDSAAKNTFANFEDESDDENENAYTATPEVFQTPMEEVGGGFGDEVFGQGRRERVLLEEEKMGEEVRTLSLSRVTLGRGAQQAGVNF